MAEERSVLEQLDVVLRELESNDSEFAAKISRFLTESLVDVNEPETWKLALQYATWALKKGKIASRKDISHKCDVCLKDTGWIFSKVDGSAKPCDKCRSSRIEKWQKDFVDSDKPPY